VFSVRCRAAADGGGGVAPVAGSGRGAAVACLLAGTVYRTYLLTTAAVSTVLSVGVLNPNKKVDRGGQRQIDRTGMAAIGRLPSVTL
jgi:hypothetical protein